jgi:ferric-dicitrate binding protein FerR (iron transport regulator)
MAGMSHYQARAHSDRTLRASDLERELRRMRESATPGRGRAGSMRTIALVAVVAALFAYIVTADDGKGGLALMSAFTTLFG